MPGIFVCLSYVLVTHLAEKYRLKRVLFLFKTHHLNQGFMTHEGAAADPIPNGSYQVDRT